MQTLVAEILAAWRRAERLADRLTPGTHDHGAAVMASERLRDLFRDLTADEVEPLTEAGARTLLEELAGSPSLGDTKPA